jgi:asparagine synthase (glutamine-hydrolysing)
VWTIRHEATIAEIEGEQKKQETAEKQETSKTQETPKTQETETERIALGHVLHAMVGCVPEPLRRTKSGGVLVANCEIYNWHLLAQADGIKASNDADLLCALLDELTTVDPASVSGVCERLDGVYAFAYAREERVVLVRDILGVKPLVVGFRRNDAEEGETRVVAFASEPKALRAAGYSDVVIRELQPRTVLDINTRTGAFCESTRPFFDTEIMVRAEYAEDEAILSKELAAVLHEAIEKRVPQGPFALFLGGGIDSAILAHVLAPWKPRCYTVGVEGSHDVAKAKALCRSLALPVTVVTVDATMVEERTAEIIEVIEDGNAVKTAVGVVTWFASAAASRDGVRCAFSGLGADEVFAATARARASTDARREIISALRVLHERALFRDDAIAMRHGIEIRLPFLDRAVITWSLNHTRNAFMNCVDKPFLRQAAVVLGVPQELSRIPRRAPQYGSGVMRLFATKGKRIGATHASVHGTRRRLVALLSGGKDSVLAVHCMSAMGYAIACAITIESDNPDSYLYHTPNVSLAKLQAEAMSIPFLTARTHGEPERELEALERTLFKARDEYPVEGVVTGAIRSHYQRERIERVADRAGLTTFAPLWQTDQLEELRRLLREGYRVVFTKVAAEGLDASWLGEPLTERRVAMLARLAKARGIQPAGEGGEYETLVLDAPLFHSRIVLDETQVIKDGMAATLVIHDARLVPK